jgi:putative hydrolase of HD superfamily
MTTPIVRSQKFWHNDGMSNGDKSPNGGAQKSEEQKIVDFIFEVGTMRKLARIHRQTLLTDDLSDNIAAHSYRAALIGWHLAKMEGVDSYKTVMMCLLHDTAETRSGDHNWVHKKYVKIFEDEIVKDQLGSLPYGELNELASEYHQRESKEAIIAKDADLLDQIFLLREYEWQGTKEAKVWLEGKNGKEGNDQGLHLHSESAKKVAKEAFSREPSAWWGDIWTSENR